MQSVKKASLSDLDSLVPLFEAYRFFYGKDLNRELSTTFLKARLKIENRLFTWLTGGKNSWFYPTIPPFFLYAFTANLAAK